MTSFLSGFLYYAPFFICGGILARERMLLLRLVVALRRRVLYVLLAGALLLYFNRMMCQLERAAERDPHTTGSVDADGVRARSARWAGYDERSLPISWVVCLIVCIWSTTLSCSHCLTCFTGTSHLPLLASLCLAGTVGVAHVFCIGVEEPALRLG